KRAGREKRETAADPASDPGPRETGVRVRDAPAAGGDVDPRPSASPVRGERPAAVAEGEDDVVEPLVVGEIDAVRGGADGVERVDERLAVRLLVERVHPAPVCARRP